MKEHSNSTNSLARHTTNIQSWSPKFWTEYFQKKRGRERDRDTR